MVFLKRHDELIELDTYRILRKIDKTSIIALGLANLVSGIVNGSADAMGKNIDSAIDNLITYGPAVLQISEALAVETGAQILEAKELNTPSRAVVKKAAWPLVKATINAGLLSAVEHYVGYGIGYVLGAASR